MRCLAEKQELMQALLRQRVVPDRAHFFQSGMNHLDDLAPNAGFQFGVVHELLSDRGALMPQSIALLLARAAQGQKKKGAIVWSDPGRELYPPALAAEGIDLRKLIVLRCAKRSDELWALSECLGCKGVSATFASIPRLTRVEARRLQLAAERGGGIGIFHRPFLPGANSAYAAATRWLVKPVAGDDEVQRWSMELVHGHGGRIGEAVLLEVDRETRVVRTSAPVADRPVATPPIRITA
jgi:protein ImuA